MRLFLLSMCLIMTGFIQAQESGSIVGTVTDAEMNNEPLPFANVLIKGTTKGTTTDFDGLYELANLEPGSYTIVFSFLGYETTELPNIVVEAGKVTQVDIPMSANEGVSLDEVVVTTTTRKDSEAALLLDQKRAVEMKTSIGAQELARKGVSDVATAVTKTSGVSRQEGSSDIFVRGLGDRYNITTLNGLPLPSNNPSKKNIELTLFPTDIVEYIGIDKTYNPQNYGDFAGANVNIVSRDYKGSGFFQVGAGTGVNTEPLGQSDFYLNDGPGFTGFYDTDYPAFPLNNYNFNTSWDREKGPTPINSDLSLKGGYSHSLSEDTRLSFFGVASYGNSYSYREGVSRGGINTSAVPDGDLDYNNYAYNTNTTLMGNLGVRHKQQSLKYNILYLNTSSQKQLEYNGIIDKDDDAQEGGGFIQRAVFERTSVLINQLLGDHQIGDQLEVNWGASYNISSNLEPDRRQVTLLPVRSTEPDGPKSFQLVSAASDNHRFYADLEENEFAANIATSYKFKKNADELFDGKVTLGYNGRMKQVDFEATQFNFRIMQRDANGNIIQQPVVDPYNVDAYFNQANINAGYYRIETFRGSASIPNALDPQTYGGDQNIHAGFVNVEYALSPKFKLLAGVRGEHIYQSIAWTTSLDAAGGESEYDAFEILPALSLKYELNDKQNLRLAGSKTYTLPQYKERAFFLFQEVNQDYQGNPALYASTDYNLDLKWELFPQGNELFSIGVFGKYIEDPINTAVINSASNDISYVNSGDWAMAMGAELEAQKNLFETEVERGDDFLKTNLSVGLNVSYMYSNQELNDDKVLEETTAAGYPLSVTFTEEEDRISGASDLLLNADVSYYKDFAKDKNILATLAYNYFSDRIYALGVLGKGNIVDKGVGTLDFILRSQFNEHMGISFKAVNLLDPTVERFQDIQDVTVLDYKKGRGFSLSFTYNF